MNKHWMAVYWWSGDRGQGFGNTPVAYNEKGFTFGAIRDAEAKLRADIFKEFGITVYSLVIVNLIPLVDG